MALRSKKPVIQTETVKKIKNRLDQKREKQGITKKLMKKINKKGKRKSKEKNTEEESENEIMISTPPTPKPSAKNTAHTFSDSSSDKEETKEVILVGEEKLPEKQGQIVTKIDPYSLQGTAVENVGKEPEKANIVYGKIRFDNNYLLVIEEIELPKKLGYSVSSYSAWTIRKVPKDQPDVAEYINKDGKKVKTFNFTGRLSTLPELHRALKKLTLTAQGKKIPELDDAMRLKPNKNQIVDLSDYTEETYTNTVFVFGDFAAYVEPASFKSSSGHLTTYQALALTKKKSDKVKICYKFIYKQLL